MQRMIEQLLDLTRARLTSGITVKLSTEEIDVAAIVARIADEVRAAHPRCTIEMRVDEDCGSRIDVDRFEQVVSNLLINAVTHGDNTRPIQVVVASKPDGVSLKVQNHGPPIDAAFLPLIFSPFARTETTQRSSAGLGLGLYISERIIAAHGGRLSVQSSLEAGTEFEVLLTRQSQRRPESQ